MAHVQPVFLGGVTVARVTLHNEEEVARMALVVLSRFEIDRPIRLLGVRVVLEPPEPARA